MRIKYEFLDDIDFLKSVDESPIRETYAKFTLLDWKENPISEIQGIITDGNINITNSSSVRRTANLTVLLDEDNNKITQLDNSFSLNKKVYIELGYKNFTTQYQQYPILWYPQGIFIISATNLSYDTSGKISAQISLKDKMCLINGDIGGIFPASVSLSTLDQIDSNGKYYTTYPSIYQIILYMVKTYGGEDPEHIIITDVPEYIDRVLAWKPTTSGGVKVDSVIYYNNETFSLTNDDNDAEVYSYGEDVGKIKELYVWPTENELTVTAGSSVTSALDKIVQQLGGNFEYFYDIYGNFVFQEIKNYLNTSQLTSDLRKLEAYNVSTENNELVEEANYTLGISASGTKYTFDNDKLFTSYSNSPSYTNIKNDYVIWGSKEDASGTKIPIRYHVAIDEKPTFGDTSREIVLYNVTTTVGSTEETCTWGAIPLVYESKDSLPNPGNEEAFYKVDKNLYVWDVDSQEYIIPEESDAYLVNYVATDWRTELYLRGLESEVNSTEENPYFAELKTEWPKLYDLNTKKLKYSSDNRKDVSSINYWLDFIDTNAESSIYSIDNIGRRAKAISADTSGANCIFENEVPEVYILKEGDTEQNEIYNNYSDNDGVIITVPSEIYKNFANGGEQNSALEYFRSIVYQDLSYGESIQISSVPIYYLEPNNLISVLNETANIYGDYIIETISYNFSHDATMNLNCKRVLTRI